MASDLVAHNLVKIYGKRTVVDHVSFRVAPGEHALFVGVGDCPPACRDSDSPHPRRRGSRYCICARLTCALPSRLRAC